MAREKNTARSDARRRTRIAEREARATDAVALTSEETAAEADEPVASDRPSLFRMPDVMGDIRALPDMFRTRRLLWLPFVLLLGSFFAALGMPYTGLDAGVAQFLALYVQMAFLPQGLIVFLIGGFVATRGAYLVGFILGVANAVLLLIFAALRTEAVLAAGTDPSAAGEAQVGLTLLIGYALVVGPLAAAFAAWYRNFLNRMGAQGRERRVARETERQKKLKEEARAARRPARKTT